MTIMKNNLIIPIFVFTVFSFAGCSKDPLDVPLDMSSLNAVSESSSKQLKLMDEDEKKVSDWAVKTLGLDNIQSLSSFKEQYGDKVTYRIILKKAVENREQIVSDELQRLKELKPSWDATYDDLSKIKASNIHLGSSAEFMTQGHPLISFDVHNGSKEDISLIVWRLELFLNGEKEPYTTYNAVDSYSYGQKNNGLLKGETVRREVTVDTFFNRQNADKWVDLNARKASSKLVKVTVIPTRVEDFNKQEFITGDIDGALAEFEVENKIIELAKKYT